MCSRVRALILEVASVRRQIVLRGSGEQCSFPDAHGTAKKVRALAPEIANSSYAWEAVQTLVRYRPLVSASADLIGPGDDSWAPRTSAIVPFCPSAWLQCRRLFCGSR